MDPQALDADPDLLQACHAKVLILSGEMMWIRISYSAFFNFFVKKRFSNILGTGTQVTLDSLIKTSLACPLERTKK
jgi:hypothetical protein